MKVPSSMSLDHARKPERKVYANIAEYRKAQARKWDEIRGRKRP